MDKKRKAPQCGNTFGAKAKNFRTYYNSLSREKQQELKEDIHDIIGGIGIFFGLCVIVVLMLLVG